MSAKSFVHIGLAKTGTTSIQRLLSRRRGLLARDGFYYPSTGFGSGHHCLAWHVANPSKQQHFCADFNPEAFAGELKDKSDHSIIVSSEELSLLSFDKTKIQTVLDFLPHEEKYVLAYVREQAEFFNSFYFELVSDLEDPGPADAFFEQIAAELRYDYSYWFALWRQILGENLLIRPYDKNAMSDSDVISDFCETVGCYGLLRRRRIPQQNISLNNLQAAVFFEIIRRSKKENGGFPLSIETKRELKRFMAPLLADPQLSDGDRVWAISPDLLQSIRSKFARKNLDFFALSGMRGFVFASTVESPAVTLRDFEELPQDLRDQVDLLWESVSFLVRQDVGSRTASPSR